MPLFLWQESFSVGVPFIDTDHQILISLINQLNEACEEGQARDVIGSVLNVLIEYTINHFRREERLMELGHYPDLEPHRELHRKLAAEVEKYQADYASGRQAAADELLGFLKTWLTGHILAVDTRYTPFVGDVVMAPEDLVTSFDLSDLDDDGDEFREELD